MQMVMFSVPESFFTNGTFFELRCCKNSIAEIWRATPTSKKGRTKLKEQMIYQRGDARIRSMEVCTEDFL